MRDPWWPHWTPWTPNAFGYGVWPHAFGPRYSSSLSLGRMRAERDLADFCMRARGYELQPVPEPQPAP